MLKAATTTATATVAATATPAISPPLMFDKDAVPPDRLEEDGPPWDAAEAIAETVLVPAAKFSQ